MKKLIARSIITLGVMGVALGLATTQVNAAPIVFEVDEGAVPGANDVSIFPDGITSKYLENLTLGPGNTWSATLLVNFTDYTLAGVPITSQVAPATGEPPDSNLYSLYALVTASGTFAQVGNVFTFQPTNSTADIYTDPDRDTDVDYTDLSRTDAGDDQYIATATNLDQSESIGLVVLDGSGNVITGSFALRYQDVTLIAPDGTAYWIGLSGLNISGIASGDVDPTSEGSVFPTGIRGDASIAFLAPEPASMTLFGLALFGAGIAARRRRTE
jgi:hypothetical protein